jgi:hypothetical protein
MMHYILLLKKADGAMRDALSIFFDRVASVLIAEITY